MVSVFHRDICQCSHLNFCGLYMYFLSKLRQGALGLQYKVVGTILVVDAADHIQNGAAQV